MLYPTETPEVNCMIALEAQALGVPSVTTDDFALRNPCFKPTRVEAPWGTPNYVTEFVAATVRLVKDPELPRKPERQGPGTFRGKPIPGMRLPRRGKRFSMTK